MCNILEFNVFFFFFFFFLIYSGEISPFMLLAICDNDIELNFRKRKKQNRTEERAVVTHGIRCFVSKYFLHK